MISADYRIDEGDDWKISITQQRLASNSVLIERKKDENPTDLLSLMQKVATLWRQQGGSNYLVYKSSQESNWEMVPYAGTPSSTWDKICAYGRQLLVLSRVTFGRAKFSGDVSIGPSALETTATVQKVAQDAFCTKAVIDAQLICEGKHIRVLYNYAPIGEEGLHYLLVPKAHKEKFTELNQDEFDEIQKFAGKLIANYPEHLCYRYSKTGRLAGQTVPHFHEHVVFLRPEHDFKGKLSVFWRMVMPPTPLNSVELDKRVKDLQARFCKN